MTLFRALAISVLIHILVWLFLWRMPKSKVSHNVPVQVVYKTDNVKPDHKKIIVRQVKIPDSLKDDQSQKDARFFSEQQQRVKKEMRAAANGETKNQFMNRKAAATQNQKQSKTPNFKKYLHPDFSDQGVDFAQKPKQDSKSKPIVLPNFAASSVGEQLPQDLQIGSMTALNTDRFLYYSFYARIETLVRHRWVTNVRNTIEDAKLRGQFHATRDTQWATALEILLDPHGKFVSASVLQASGWRAMDSAAIEAFRAASPIPHPPPEMVRSDGYIHIQYGFIVYPEG